MTPQISELGQEAGPLPSAVPLAVDLDGTLSRTDTLHEAALALVCRRPAAALSLPAWLRGGKVALKQEIAARQPLDPEAIPYDPHVLELIAEARAEGRQVILISAAHHSYVEAIAAHLGLFDEAVGVGSDGVGDVNLSGTNKADWLIRRFGAGNFDYIGNAAADIPVWRAARRALVIRPSARLAAAAARANPDVVALGPENSGWVARRLKPGLRAMRPHQWVKNLLILVPLLTAQHFEALGMGLLAMLVFSLTASGVYVMNDLTDLRADRIHPRKRRRPFAAGDLTTVDGVVLAILLFGLSGSLAVLLAPPAFVSVLILYVIVTCAYSLWLKRKLLVDIITLAGLYTIRVLAGAAAVGLSTSFWLLSFSMFMFFSLAAIKRQAELLDHRNTEKDPGQGKPSGRGYYVGDLPVVRGMAIASGQAAVLVFALYANSDSTRALFEAPGVVWLACPVLFFWLSRMELMTERGFMNDDPIVFAARDRMSVVSGLLIILILILAATGWGAHWLELLGWNATLDVA